MPSPTLSRRARAATAVVAVSVSASLVACSPSGKGGEETLTSTTPEETTEVTTSSAAESTAPSTETSTKRKRDDEKHLETVRTEFASLAPESLFDALDTCAETSLKGSYDCSGSEVGQFQFFTSESMAEDTSDVLTGLSSSRVVEDTPEKVVGWSMLGKTAVITVVDRTGGKVLQHMISSDVDDPEQRIYTLGLAEDDGSGVMTPAPRMEGSTARRS